MSTTRPVRQRASVPAPPIPIDGERPTGGAIAVRVVKRVFGAETANFFLLLGTTLFLLALGLVMVLSSSSIEDGAAVGHDFFSTFSRQGLYALAGIPLMLIASRMSIGFWKKWAWPAVIVTSALQLLVFVPGLSHGYQGNVNWIKIGAFSAQPSELVKLALILWVAWILAAKQNRLDEWKHVFIPIAPIAGIAIALVLIGRDLGTAIVMAAIVLGCLFFAGVRLRILGAAIVVVSVIVVIFIFVGGSRTHRISAYLTGCTTSNLQTSDCWQVVHGWWGIASGGIIGEGLGKSQAKWSWLPNAANDFIFAIIGDELGLIGAVVVLLLFALLAIAFVRIVRSSRDPFAKIVTSGVMIWIVGQAFVNIAVVLGILPVFGVPLPLISAGGSSLIANLVGIGVVLSFARRQEIRE